MNQADPKDLETYNRLTMRNNEIGGEGLDTFMNIPCPFCAATNFCKYPIMDMQDVLARGAKCDACGRSAKAIFKHSHSGVAMEMVQTGGDDPADWFPMLMRRV